MHVHSYQFPAPTSPTAPSSNGMMAMSVSTPGLTTMAPAPHPTVFAAPVPIAPPMIQNTYQHQHQHMHHPPAPISVKSSPSPDASQSPELLSPPSSASSDVTSISEDTGDDGEQRRQVQGTPRLEVFPASMKDEGTTYQEDQAQDYRPPSLVESEVTQPAAHPAPIELDVQPNDEFEMDLESPWLHNSEPLSRPNVGLSIHSNLLLLPSLTSTSALPLPSPPLSPHPDLEFPQPAVTAGTTTAPVMPVAEQVIVPPSPTFSPSPSIPEPSPRSASPSESRNENIAVSSSEPPEPVLPKKRIERGYSSEPRAQLLFEPLSSAGHVVDLFTADDDEDESAGNVVERPHQVHSPLVEDLIRSIALSGHEPMYGGTRSSSSYWSGLTRRSSSPAPEKLTSATKAAATTATTVTTIGVARSKSSRTFIPGHTKRPSMNAPSIIISPSMNGSGFADNKTNKGMAARVNAAAASMLPSPAPDSPLPGQESMTYEQRLKLLSESQPLNAAGARAPSPVVEKEDEDMPLAWVQMRLRN
ncbi:hypothetical protein BGZ73_006472 [Actinomortierella ambigua]|nr:hypothetical protein BGZ73_006472 [Actinomortierella ambigua]